MPDTPKANPKLGDKFPLSEEVIQSVYRELKQLAAFYLRDERKEHTLQPTALVNEAYLQLAQQQGEWANSQHFFRGAAQVMRHILVDYARARGSDKRGGGEAHIRLDLVPDELAGSCGMPADVLLGLDAALSELAEKDPRQAHLVELRFFGGLTEQDACRVLGISPRTGKRDWQMARAWLYGRLKRGENPLRCLAGANSG